MAASEVVHHCGLPRWPSRPGRHRSLRRRQIGRCPKKQKRKDRDNMRDAEDLV